MLRSCNPRVDKQFVQKKDGNTSLNINSTAFWLETSYSSDKAWRFEGIYLPHLQGWSVIRAKYRQKKAASWALHAFSNFIISWTVWVCCLFLYVYHVAYYSTICSYEKSGSFWATRRYNPEECTLRNHSMTVSISNMRQHFSTVTDIIPVILKQTQPKLEQFGILIRVRDKQPGNQGLIPGEDKYIFPCSTEPRPTRIYARSRKVVGSIPDEVIEYFN
jgi:hypothetical protein